MVAEREGEKIMAQSYKTPLNLKIMSKSAE